MEGRQSIPPPDGSGTDSDETQTSDPASRRASLNQLTNGELRKYVYDERREQREREAALHAALRAEAGAHRAAQEAHRAAEEVLRAAAAEERRAAEVRLRAAEERERLALELAASRCCEIM